jgi:hypothetical protein
MGGSKTVQETNVLMKSNRKMKKEEEWAENYLKHCGYPAHEINFEPDGNVPPDFLVQKTIAIEVRRLHQHWTSPAGDEIPLECAAVPVAKILTRLLDSFGAPSNGVSWLVRERIKRPFSMKKEEWEPIVKNELLKLQSGLFPDKKHKVVLHDHFRIEFTRMSKPGLKTFMQIDYDDDKGGWVNEELEKNISLCIAKKTTKIARYKSKYPKWWLVLVDFMFDGRLADDQTLKLSHPEWDRVIVIHPADYSLAYDV